MTVKTCTCKLRTNEKSAAALQETMQRFNHVCNILSAHAFEHQVFRQFDLHKALYHKIRSEHDLPSQLVIRAIAVVTDSYKNDRSVPHTFGAKSAVVFDARCFKLKNLSSAILTTTQGRVTCVMAHGGKQRAMLEAGKIGEADLIFRDGDYYLAITVTLPDPPARDTSGGVLGVDLGIAQIATDSEGHQYSGEQVKNVRQKVRRIRKRLQSKGTKKSKVHLLKIRKKQSRFTKDVNHCIAKNIVQTAIGSAKAIALELLTGIRDRGHGYGREMRWLLGNWSFFDLAAKIVYKAKEAGIPVFFVDPAYTSQTCSCCGHCEKANRKSLSVFKCQKCGFESHADLNAALNIETRAEMSTCLLESAA